MSKRNKPRCESCVAFIDECQCGCTRSAWTSLGVACPYCGHFNRSESSDGILYSESIETYFCGDCCAQFGVTAHVRWTWQSRRIEAAETTAIQSEVIE